MAETKDRVTRPEPMNASRWGVRAVDTGFVRVYINGLLFDFDPGGAAELAQTIRVILGIEKPLDAPEITGDPERDALKAELAEARAAIEPVCERLDWLIDNGFGARTADLVDLRAALDAPHHPEDATAIHHADDCWITTHQTGECDCGADRPEDTREETGS